MRGSTSAGDTVERYREIASSIRAAARVIGLPENRTSLFNLASTYEDVAIRMEATVDDGRAPINRITPTTS